MTTESKQNQKYQFHEHSKNIKMTNKNCANEPYCKINVTKTLLAMKILF